MRGRLIGLSSRSFGGDWSMSSMRRFVDLRGDSGVTRVLSVTSDATEGPLELELEGDLEKTRS